MDAAKKVSKKEDLELEREREREKAR